MIRYTASALADIDQAISYLEERNVRAAEELRARLEAAIERLGRMPMIGRTGRVAGTREWSVVNAPYILAYRVIGADIEILAVRHERRRWPDHFE